MSGVGMSLGAARLIAGLARSCEILLEHTPAGEDVAEVLDARETLKKHAAAIEEARRLIYEAGAVDKVDSTPSMAWTCPTCHSRPFEPCVHDGKFGSPHADRLPPGAKR